MVVYYIASIWMYFAGFPDGGVMLSASDVEEDDRKTYSSDSESDKDSKDSKSGNKTDTDVNMLKKNGGDETSSKSSSSASTSDDSACRSDNAQFPDTETKETDEKETDEKETTLKDGESGKSESGQSKSNSRKENTESEDVEMEEDNKSESAKESRTTESTKISDLDKIGDKKMNNNDNKVSENNCQVQVKEKESLMFDVVDNDDYLLYLEDILKKIHRRFFDEYRSNQQNGSDEQVLPDLKIIVPELRLEVLKGVNIVLSGVVPQQMKLKDSKAYFIATSLGACVSDRLIVKVKGDPASDHKKMYTTHVVAANIHTEKVNVARKYKYIKVCHYTGICILFLGSVFNELDIDVHWPSFIFAVLYSVVTNAVLIIFTE